MGPLVRSAIAFNCRPALITTAHPLIAALLQGLNLPSSSSTTLYEAIGSSPHRLHDYLRSVWAGRLVSCWTQVLLLFDVDSIISAGDEYRERERGFIASMFRYLAKSAGNTRQFLHAVTGNPYIPLADHGGRARLKVSLLHYLLMSLLIVLCTGGIYDKIASHNLFPYLFFVFRCTSF